MNAKKQTQDPKQHKNLNPKSESAVNTLLKGVPVKLLIGGRWVTSGSAKKFTVHNPADNSELADIADATPADALKALDAASSAQDNWAKTPPRERAEILRRAFDLVTERSEEFATLITLEMGKPLAESRSEVKYGAEFLRWFSEEAPRIIGRYNINPEGTGRALVHYRPVGPSYLITPWNFPLAMATRKIAPALAAGCTVIIKPASLTPLTTLLFAQVLQEAGVPSGVVNVITTTQSSAVTEKLLADRRLRKLSFTGSTAVGRSLMKLAADNILRVSMELGGNAPFIVFEDANLKKAVDGALLAKFRNIGQACTAANRLLVHEKIAEKFTKMVTKRVKKMPVAEGLNPDAEIGPLINADAVSKVQSLVKDAIKRGASVETGGEALAGNGNFYQATVLKGVHRDSELLREEIFGPVLPIVTFSSEDEAIGLANDTEYGLVAYAYTESLSRMQRLSERLETGMLGINVGVVSNAAAPFGGVKHSGVGREGSHEGILEYLETMYVTTPDPFKT